MIHGLLQNLRPLWGHFFCKILQKVECDIRYINLSTRLSPTVEETRVIYKTTTTVEVEEPYKIKSR